jgi:hypothetical protein
MSEELTKDTLMLINQKDIEKAVNELIKEINVLEALNS